MMIYPKTYRTKNMKEKILALLKTKFIGVDDAILDRIATKKAEGVTDEAQLPAIVEGIGFQDVLQSYGDYRAGDATQTAVRNYEKRHNLKDGKPIERPAPEPTPQDKPEPAQKKRFRSRKIQIRATQRVQRHHQRAEAQRGTVGDAARETR